MDEKDIFNMIDNLDEKKIIEVFDEFSVDYNEDDEVNETIRENIRAKLHSKIEHEKSREKKRNPIVRLLKVGSGLIAATLLFVIMVNVSPSVANALEKIPVIDKLVQAVKMREPFNYDKGFDSLIDNGQYQVINKTVEQKGIKFKVNSIIGDGSKLWISYDYNSENKFLGNIKFYNMNGNELSWGAILHDDRNYIEVIVDGTLEDFTLAVDVYKDDEKFHKPVSENGTQEEINIILKELEKNKIGNLNLAIDIDENIFTEGTAQIYKIEKKISTDAVDIVIKEIQLSMSRTRLVCEFKKKDYDNLNLANLKIIDGDNNTYYSEDENPNINLNKLKDRSVIIDFDGGVLNSTGLRLVCSDIRVINSQKTSLGYENVHIDTENFIDGFDVKLLE